ncbi:type I polyketide synthase [Streptomyces sp. NBC_01485]|uniref:type I polyketide synthase n=1 Tax=Streptomyces sp. NBC_01485 TaxID=2903884 RepID=UPI002E317205|nr:SDR family NAD(P)-dependent oxidoreductase [Streptomyces sp. NBC_01485]
MTTEVTAEQKLRDYLKRATADLRLARRRVRELEETEHEPVAVVGMACRFPGGIGSPEELWEFVTAGGDAISAFPADRGWDMDALFSSDPDRSGTSYLRNGGFLYDAGDFDAEFFGISPREAMAMDPQQRLLLETSWEALERAAIAPDRLRGERVGVYVGALASDYGPPSHRAPGAYEGYLTTGNASSVASGRLAFTLGLEGPALTVDTACSSSLVALHLAVQALRRGECTMALTGGVTVMSQPGTFVDLGRQQGLAPDGRCKAFAAGADGFGPAEGVGMLVVERLSDARRLGHRVLAVVRGSVVNQDGASNGLTAPSGPAQERLVRAALAGAGLAAGDVDVVEAHGTGTKLGDPIEARALLATYGQGREPERPLLLGSVKSNIGHTQAAAGVAGVIKMVMALRHGVLPASLHVDEPSSLVDWSSGAVEVVREAVAWPDAGRVRRAGVSSFGISGTNAHVILEQAEAEAVEAVEAGVESAAPVAEPVVALGGITPWVVSGRGAAALRAVADRLAGTSGTDVVGVAGALVGGRATQADRAVVWGRDTAELTAGLDAVARGETASGTVSGVARSGGVVFVFPGQGAQWVGMGRELLAVSPVFAASVAECEAALSPWVEWSLTGVLAGDGGELAQVDVVQPVLWAVMVSLAAVWRSVGVVPVAVVGHSQGEIAAACVAGALSLEDAARVVAVRSRAITRLAGTGGMVSVFASSERVAGLLVEGVGVAAVNGPGSVVVSGEVAALDVFLAGCAEAGVEARRVAVDYASHSVMVEALESEITESLKGVVSQAPAVPMLSTYSGEWVKSGELDGGYWYGNLRHRVRLADAVAELSAAGHGLFVEVSPHPVLTAAVQDTLDETPGGDGNVVALGTLRRDQGGAERLLTSVAEAFVHGADVDWTVLLPVEAAVKAADVDLPTYPFQRERYWLDSGDARSTRSTRSTRTTEPAEATGGAFWEAVDQADLGALTEALGVDGDQPLSEVLPALSAWRGRRRDEAVVDSWRYRVTWQPVAADRDRPDGTWLLVLPPDSGPGTPAHRTAEALATIVPVVRLVPKRTVALDRAELAALVRDSVADTSTGTDTGPIAGVLSLLALDETPAEGPDARLPHVSGGLAATLVLLQALGDAGLRAPLWCVTRGAVSLNAADAPASVTQAEVWGLGRVAALEHPDRWGGLVDLPETLDERAVRRLHAALAGVRGGVPGAEGIEDQLAIRASGLFVRRLERAPLGDRPPVRSWRPRGTVLVTGATGAVGRHLALWLAAEGAEHLVLTSRRPADTPELDVLRRDIAATGTTVTLAACDVADRAALAALIQRTTAEGHRITAVVHAAALIQLGALDDVGLDELSATLAAKAAGADHLDELFDDDSLDAFVLFSSIAGVWGSGDHGTYAAGNAHIDALAQRRRARGRTALSVAWGVWDGCVPEGFEGEPERHGLPTIAPRLAFTALRQALEHDETHIAVAEVDWERFTTAFTSARPRPLLAGVPDVRSLLSPPEAAAPGGAPHAAPAPEALSALRGRLADRTEAEQHAVLLELVLRHTAEVLGHQAQSDGTREGSRDGTRDGIRTDRPFRELGVDSLTSVDLRNRLAAATGLRLPAALVFNHPTPLALARHLAEQVLGGLGDLKNRRSSAAAAVVRPGPTDREDEPIAIVGMACRYPGGVRSPEDLWDLVAAGGDAVSGLPTNRGWDLAGMYDPDPSREGTCYTREGGFLHDVADFDPVFFGISPREALTMDPQQRLLLETSWEAFERADIDPTRMRGSSTGVFVGINYQDYGTGAQDLPDGGEGHLLTGTVPSVASGRVAYTLGLEGPAITLDTACSSSLVALHMAAQSLRRGECDMALAGGVAVMYTPRSLIGFSRQGGLAVDGRCKAFAAAADGMGMAEGVGMLLVERLSDAQRLGHRVLAVVRASAINQDGASNGLSAPSGPAQERVIRAALAAAGLTSSDVDAVEAHGTGTKLGDPIEAEALLATYGQGREGGRPLWLGSVKSNIGHTQAASGVAGVMKMVSAMRHGVLPASLHVDEPSSFVDWSSGGVEVVREAVVWPDAGRVRRAGVSSFGISGTNAHVILEQAEVVERAGAAELAVLALALDGVVPWVVSGRGAGALAAQAERLAEYAGGVGEAELQGMAYRLVTGRATFADRAVVVGRNLAELTSRAEALASGAETSGVVAGSVVGSGVVFVFPGQGAQWVGMGRELLAVSPVFAASVAECEAALSPWVEWSLTGVLAGDGAELAQVDVVQPVLWAVMVSLAAVWRSVGVVPVAVVGHSQGEIAAACVAGALSLEDAARVVAVRSRAITRLAGTGGMVSVFASAERVAGLLVEGVGVAAVNGPGSVVVSGEVAALDVFLAGCVEAGVEARRVAVDYASHSVMVEALESEITESLQGVVSQAPAVPMLSTYTGEWVKPGELDGSYWYGNLRHRVRLADAVAELSAAGHGLFVEVSPHPVLTAAVQDTLDETPGGDGGAVALGTLRRDQGGAERLLTSVAEAFVHGADVDWRTVLPAGAGHVDLPTYAFQRQRYWLSPASASAQSAGSAGGTAMDEVFWSVVESGDLDAVADTLGVDGDRPLSEVLPALSAWRGRQDEAAAIGSWRYRVDWLPARLDGPGALSGTWLVVAPPGVAAGRLAAECAAALADRGAEVVRGGAEATDAPPAAYVRILREAGPVAGVLSLLALDSEPAGADGVPRGLSGSLALAKALIAEQVEAPLWLATSGAVEATVDAAERPSDPGQAQVWALGRVYGLEYPDRWGGLIDLPTALDDAAALRLGGVLAGGLGAEDQVALRPDGLLVRRLLRAPEPRAGGAGWRPHGTVLITGGTGGLGGQLAARLAREGARHLVLTSRRGPDAPGADELRAELVALGAEVTIAACDAADREALAELVARVEEKGGEPVTAVFHAAGIADTVPLDRTEPSHLAAAHRAKGIGTLNLEELLGDRLEAFVLFSSNAAVWGSNGLGAYGSANAFLDAFAENRRRRGLPVTSIAWGLWEGEGMAQGRPSDEMVRRGLRPMAPEWAVTAMLRSVAAGETTLSVAAVDWELFHAAFASARRRPLIEDIDDVQRLLAEERAGADAGSGAGAGAEGRAAGAGSDWAGRLGAMPPGERELALAQLVRGQAATVLGLDSPDDVPAGRAFRELGFDSMMAVDIRGRLSRSTGLKLPATLIFDHPTPQVLARHLVAQLVPAESAAGARLRQLLEAIPVDRLEAGAAGVEAALRALLDGAAPEPAGIPDAVGAVEDDAIDAMDVASLVRLAFDPAE